jgi:hypothetical protein
MHSNGALAWLRDAALLADMGAVSLIIDAPGGPNPASAEESRDGMIQTSSHYGAQSMFCLQERTSIRAE